MVASVLTVFPYRNIVVVEVGAFVIVVDDSECDDFLLPLRLAFDVLKKRLFIVSQKFFSSLDLKRTRPDTRLPQSPAGGQGPY